MMREMPLHLAGNAVEMKRAARCFQHARSPETHKAVKEPMSMSFPDFYTIPCAPCNPMSGAA
jgi:hypothetical protein